MTDDLTPRRAACEVAADLRAWLLADLAAESVPLSAVADRALAEALTAPADRPPRDRATMDGFAVDATVGYPLDYHDGAVYPEDDPGDLPDGGAVPVATGAALPAGANAVLKREDATVDGGLVSGVDLDPGENVYRQGTNVRAGEELFAAGERLSPKDAALLRDLGVDEVGVRRRLSVGVLATGTEIHEGRQPDRDSEMLAGLVDAWGHDAALAGSVPDDPDAVRERVADLAADHDVVLSTGGTSVGHKDYAVAALSALGDLVVRGVAIRPGRPVTVARLDDYDAAAVALPGKPVAALTAATLVARSLFVGETGLPGEAVPVARDYRMPDRPREYVVPVAIEDGEAMPYGHADSPLPLSGERFRPGLLSAATRATRADGFVVTESDLVAGESATVVPYGVVQ